VKPEFLRGGGGGVVENEFGLVWGNGGREYLTRPSSSPKGWGKA